MEKDKRDVNILSTLLGKELTEDDFLFCIGAGYVKDYYILKEESCHI